MRLLYRSNGDELCLTKDLIDDIPPYAILSHTWGSDEDEVTFEDLKGNNYKIKAGYEKIEFCGKQAQTDGLKYFWVDTCCIDKTSSAELQEAITSMFSWYQKSTKCYVYLPDVSSPTRERAQNQQTTWETEFQNSKWFTRGWTLQELLAPKSVEFFSEEQQCLGDKQTLKDVIHWITGIPIVALNGCPLAQFSVEDRMLWAAKRNTKRKEDKAYCLLGIFEVSMFVNYGEGEERALARLGEEINKDLRKIQLVLEKLPYAKGAAYDAYEQCHATCHPSTRLNILREIQDWAYNFESKSIFWLNGWAGTGKSTISTTFATWLADRTLHGPSRLGASFFFKRGEGDRGSASRLFPTIARDLASSVPGLNSIVADAITANTTISEKTLGEQFDKLIYQPLQKVGSQEIRSILVIVVDALDECENERDIKAILELWSRLTQISSFKLKVFLTSRPELPIQLGFKRMADSTYQDMILHDAVPQSTIQHDIYTYLRDELSRIREDSNSQRVIGTALGEEWPGEQVLQILANMAAPLFIVAATVCRFVGDLKFNPRTRLEQIVKLQGIGTKSQMEQTYLPVLQQMLASAHDSSDREMLCQLFRKIVGSIAVLAEPLSIASLSELLELPEDDICSLLSSLHSVLRVPSDMNTPVRTLHLSFSEFLLNEKLQDQPFRVDGQAAHLILLSKSLELLSSETHGLHENLCSLTYPGQPRRELDSRIINERLSSAVQYACLHWVYHVKHSNVKIFDNDQVHMFLQKRFLHWLEALSLLGRLAEVISNLGTLQSLSSTKGADIVVSFLEDARRFVLANRYIADLAPLQLYSSAVVFAPQESMVRKVCGRIPTWLRTSPVTPTTWSAELQTLEGHTDLVDIVAFSPNGSLLASASHDGTIRLWNVNTGQEVQMWNVHKSTTFNKDWISAVAFSPDGSMLALGSTACTTKLWNINTGQEIYKYKASEEVRAVIFSPDGLTLAFHSIDGMISLWNISTNQKILQVVREGSISLAFSPDGSFLASATSRGITRLWNVNIEEEDQFDTHTHISTTSISGMQNAAIFSPDGSSLAGIGEDGIGLWNWKTGQEVRILVGSDHKVMAVAFLTGGSLLASGSVGGTIRLWDLSTGQNFKVMGIATGAVETIAFSPNGLLLASGSSDRTVRLWTVQASQQIDQRSTTWVSDMVVLPHSVLLAIGSEDGTVRLRSLQTHQEKQLKGHNNYVTRLTYSPDEDLLASASTDKTIKLWNICTGKELKTLTGHKKGANDIVFSVDGTLLASGSTDGTVRIWNVGTGQEIRKLGGHKYATWAVVAFSPDTSLVAAGGGTVTAWNINTGEPVQKFELPGADVTALAFSSDGALLVTAYSSYETDTELRHISLWNVRTGREEQIFDAPKGILRISLSSNNKTILTDRGSILIDKLQKNEVPTAESQIKEIYITEEGWIRVNGYNCLWLPKEYREALTVYNDHMFAFGMHPEYMSLIGFDPLQIHTAIPTR